MRISDLSSDVCSSDLRWTERPDGSVDVFYSKHRPRHVSIQCMDRFQEPGNPGSTHGPPLQQRPEDCRNAGGAPGSRKRPLPLPAFPSAVLTGQKTNVPGKIGRASGRERACKYV